MKVFFISCLVLCVLNGLALPAALLASSVFEFSSVMDFANPLQFVLSTFLQSAGVFVFWPLFIFLVFSHNPKTQGFMAVTAALLAISSLVNAFLFPGNYGDLSSSLEFINAVDFSALSFFSFFNVIVLFISFLLFFLALRKAGAGLFILVSKILFISLLVFSAVNSLRIASQYSEFKGHVDQSRVESIEPVFKLSRNHPNIVLIMLDRAQPQFVSEIFREHPGLEKSFSGFTLYENAVSFNAHTLAGLPPLFGGYEYTPLEMNRRAEEPLAQKNNQAQLLLPLVLQNALGFTSVIADPQYGNYSSYCDTSFIEPYSPGIRGVQTKDVYSSFWYREKNPGLLSDPRTDSLRRNLLFFSFFRSSPAFMRRFVYKGGSYWSTSSKADMKEFIDSYSVLDYMKELTGISETDSGCYMSLVNEITHCSVFLQAPGYIPVDDVTDRGSSVFSNWGAYHTQMAAFRMLASWLDFLRDEGVYDNTRIVIASDHGCRGEEAAIQEDKELDRRITGGDYHGRGHYHPLLMFKDFGDGREFQADRESFMTNADAPALLLRSLASNPVNPFTGKAIPTDTAALKADGVVISASDAHRPSENGTYRYSIKDSEWWLVRNSVFDASSWIQIEPPD